MKHYNEIFTPRQLTIDLTGIEMPVTELLYLIEIRAPLQSLYGKLTGI